ncbi:hypothetical protein Tco_1022816 [Tanacetum coccineum]
MAADPTTSAESPPVAECLLRLKMFAFIKMEIFDIQLLEFMMSMVLHTRLGSLKVLVYEGVKMTPSYSKPITKIGELLIVLTSYDVLKVLTADIVLTTYDVLREDLNHDNDRHEVYHHLMRYPKRYPVIPYNEN